MTAAKEKQGRRAGALLVLMDEQERAAIDEAAAEDGVGTGTWLRMLGLREARARKSKRAGSK